jgi:hypothetical protein
MNKTRFLLLAAFLSLMIGLSGCGNAKRDLVGKWRFNSDANSAIWEFRDNGGVIMGSIQGRYSLGDRDRIKIETGSSTAVYELSLAGDQMTLKDPRGTKLELVRVKP